MNNKISVVINTYNEEKNLRVAIKSVKWADEVVVCDMESTDRTLSLAKALGVMVVSHKNTGYVEPGRNFAIGKTSGDWILILDADEEVPTTLADRLQELAKKNPEINFVEIPRKNIIFNKWIEHTGWWPDYQIRFFKKGSVSWNNKIHSKPETEGLGLTLEAQEQWAIIHNNYRSISEYLAKLDRYTNIQAKELLATGYQFKKEDLWNKPLSEFLSRYFSNKGYQDGLHGLVLSFFQAVSFFVLYLKIWEKDGFKEQKMELEEFNEQTKIIGKDIKYWVKETKGGFFKKVFKGFKND